MLNFDDKIWNKIKGGYKELFDPRDIITQLENDPESKEAWETIWEELHHQGDIGEASYAIIPFLIDIHKRKHFKDWQIYSYISLILQESHKKGNPKVPKWIENDLINSLDVLFDISVIDIKKEKDKVIIRSILGFIALYKGLIKYGSVISSYDESEIDEIIEDRMGWSEDYE
jgi:hypothetical protein